MAVNSAGAIRAGGAFVELFAKADKLNAGLASAQAKLAAFGASVTETGRRMLTAGVLVAAPLAFAVRQFANMGSEVVDMADRTGLGIEALQELRFAAEQSGASFEDLEKAIKFMQRGGFGSTAEDFERIAEQISKMSDPAQRTAVAMQIFGRAGTQMLPLLLSGADGIRKLREEAQRLGIVMSAADAQAAEKFGDEMHVLWMQLKMVVFTIGSALAPVLRNLMGTFQGVIGFVREFIQENKWIVVLLGLIAFDLLQTGIRLLLLGPAIRAVGVAISLLTVPLALLKASMLATKFVALAMWGAIAFPVTLIIAAIAAATVAFVRFTDMGQRAFSIFTRGFENFGETFQLAWGGIRDALNDGDLEGAFKLVVLALKSLWADLAFYFGDKWRLFVFGWETIWGNTVLFFKETMGALELGWLVLTNRMADIWDLAMVTMAAATRGILGAAADALGFSVGGMSPGELATRRSDRRGAETALATNLSNVRPQAERAQREREAQLVTDMAEALNEVAEAHAALANEVDRQAQLRERREAFDFLENVSSRGGPGATLPGGSADAAGTFFASGVRGIGIGSSLTDLMRENNDQNRELLGHMRDIRNREPGVAIGD